MLVLSSRLHEKIFFPGLHTTLQVLAIQPTQVRLGIDAPEEVRILRQGLPDRAAEWGPDPAEEQDVPTAIKLQQLVDRRLAITQRGLAELGQCLQAGQNEQASQLHASLTEDMQMLRRRLRAEIEKLYPQQVPEASADLGTLQPV